MSGEIPDYLKKNFDPNSLSIPQLRSILRDHGVTDVPAPNQPKRVFVKLFNNEILNNRDKILQKLNLTEQSKKKRSGRPKKSVDDNLNSELPQALRDTNESPTGKDIKNKRVSFGGKDFKIKYDFNTVDSNKKTKSKKQEERAPLIESTIKKLNEDSQQNLLYTKSYNSEETGIAQGSVKRARQQFNEDENSSQNVEIKKTNRVEEDEEPSTKKRKRNDKLKPNTAANTSSGNIFQKFDNQNIKKINQSDNSSKIPKANIVFAEDNDDEDDEDYVYQSNSPSASSSEDDIINDEEMEDLEKDSATTSNINFSSSVGNSEASYQEQNLPVSSSLSNNVFESGTSTPQLDNINYNQIMNEGSPLNKMSKLEKPKISPSKGSSSFLYNDNNNSHNKSYRLEKPKPKVSQSFSYNPNNSFNRSSRLEKPKYSQSFSYNNGNNSFNRSYKKVPSPYNTSFNDKPKINISYDMSPIQSSQNSVIYDDTLLNRSNISKRSQNNSNIIGNLYESLSDNEENNSMEIITNESPNFSLINIFAGFMAFIITTLIGLFIQWYLSTGGFAGYCDPSKTTVSEITYLNDLPDNSILRYNPFYHILPKCLECPNNAICLNNHVVACKSKEDKLQPKLIASIVPKKYLVFPLNEPTCQFDYESKRNRDRLLQNARSLMYISNNLVRKRLGEIVCDESYESVFNYATIPPKEIQKYRGIPQSELYDLLKKDVGSQIREERFETLWNIMLGKLNTYDNENKIEALCVPENIKKWKTTETKDDTYFCEILKKFKYDPEKKIFKTTDKPIHSTRCRIKWFMDYYILNKVNKLIHRFWKYGLGIIGLTLIACVINFLIKKRNRRINVVNSICEEVIWLLQEAEYQHKEDPLHFPSPNISVAQLYDILLPTIISPKDKNVPEGECIEIINNDDSTTHYWVFHNPKERALIWKRVYDQVRANSNVLESNALVKRESHRCWEWIGNPTLYIRRKSPNTKNRQTTYYPKANNSRLSLGGVSNRSFNNQQHQQFAGDISAISSSGPNANESYMSLLGNDNDEAKEADTSLKGHISKLSIFSNRRQSQIQDQDQENEVLNESSVKGGNPSTSSSSLYPKI